MLEIKEQPRKALRKELRKQRNNLSPEEQSATAHEVANSALSGDEFTPGDHIAIYMDADGEVGTMPLIKALLARGKCCYLPVLVEETTTLEFRQYLPDGPMETNFFGLLEPPASAPTIAPEILDTVFMPLVGFDTDGNRLGMGKGYYDRTFAFLRNKASGRPLLIGLAHECQRVERLEAANWDVPLVGVITGRQFYRAR